MQSLVTGQVEQLAMVLHMAADNKTRTFVIINNHDNQKILIRISAA